MYAQVFGVLLFACQIILNESSVIHEKRNSITTTSILAPTPTTVLPTGYVSFSEDHAAYKVHQEPVTWTRARDLCIAEGAQLAIADTVEKIRHIYSLISQNDDWVSVGIQYLDATNEWVRVDNGLPLTTLPWDAGNPDDAGNCVGIAFSGDALVNFSCDEMTNWYVCETRI